MRRKCPLYSEGTNFEMKNDHMNTENYNSSFKNNISEIGLIDFHDDMIMCLCPKCRSMFFSTPGCVIKRVDKEQITKDTCTYCNVRLGFDYYVYNKQEQAKQD